MKTISAQTAWMFLALMAGYFCVSLLTIYVSTGNLKLDWSLALAAILVPMLQTLGLRLFRRFF